MKPAGEDEVLPGREFGVQHSLVSEIANAGPLRFAPSPIDGPRGGTRQAREDPEQSALARAVLSEDRENLAAIEFEVNAVQGSDSAEAFCEPLRLKQAHMASEEPSSETGVPQFEQKRQPASIRVPHCVQKEAVAEVCGAEGSAA